MILKGSARGNGADLAVHLMNSFDNESVEIADLRGAVADDLCGAFAEFEVIAQGTKARHYLYSLSINPPQRLSREQYTEAIALIEERLGLAGQPRAIVFHTKPDEAGGAREHCHVIWSRIDHEAMRAIHLSHDRIRLMDCACELARRFGLELPPGLQAWAERRKFEKEKLEPTLAEKAQAEKSGITADQRREEITEAFERADSAEALRAALAARGYILARGDRRDFVIVDEQGDVHNLTRYIKGQRTKDVRTRLAALDPDDLPNVEQAKALIYERRDKEKQARGEGEQGGDAGGADTLAPQRKALDRHLEKLQRQRRLALNIAEQALLIRQQQERLGLHAAQLRESSGLLFRTRSAVAALIGRTPGLRSVLGPLQAMTGLDPKVRHQKERAALTGRHTREKRDIERTKRTLARVEGRERQALERMMAKVLQRVVAKDQVLGNDFAKAVLSDSNSQGHFVPVRTRKELRLSEQFNDAGEYAEGMEEALSEDHFDERGEKPPEGRQRRARKPRRRRRHKR